MQARAFVLDVKERVFTAEDESQHPYTQVQMMDRVGDGTLGPVVTLSGVGGLAFAGIGEYDLVVDLRVRDGKVSMRVSSMTLAVTYTAVDSSKK